MPTAAKLVAGICFALIGWLAATAYIPALPDQFRIGDFVLVSVGLGFVIGWLIMGPNIGSSIMGAFWRGISTSVWLLVWSLIVFSMIEMIDRSLDKRYDHPVEALTSAIEIGIYFFKIALSVEVIGILAVGGALAGILTELSHRRWR